MTDHDPVLMNPYEIAGSYGEPQSADELPFFDGMPSRLRIGSLWFTVTLVTADAMNEHGPLGITNRDSCEIVIRETGNQSQDLNTTLHEINHAIFFSQGLDAEKEEEPIVERMTNGFLAMLYDNPNFARWLFEVTEEVGLS